MTLSPLISTAPAGTGIAPPKNALEAAQQFEALLLGQMLQTAHNAEDGEDPTADTMWGMAAEQFAQLLAKNGGLGLAKLVAAGLDRKP